MSEVPVQFPPPLLGVQADRHWQAIDAAGMADAENILIREGVVRSRPGVAPFGAGVTGIPLGFWQYDHEDENKRIVAGTSTRWYRWDKGTSAWVEVSDPANRLTGGKESHVLMRKFVTGSVSWLLGVNGTDVPKAWDGDVTHTYRDVLGGVRKARAIAVADDHVLMGGFVDGPAEVEYCNNLNFDAGWGSFSRNLSETEGPLISLLELGARAVAAHKSDGVYLITAYTPEYPFTFEPFQLGIPWAVSGAACVQTPYGHAVLARDGGVYLFSGTSIESLGAHIQRWIAGRWAFEKKAQSWGFWNADTSELWMCYPSRYTADMSHGVVIAMPSRAMLPFRWATLRCTAGKHLTSSREMTFGEWPRFEELEISFNEMSQEELITLFGEKGGAVYEEDGSTDAGAPIPCIIESGGNLAGGPYWQAAAARWKQVQRGDHGFNRPAVPTLVDVRVSFARRGEAREFDAVRSIDVAASRQQLRTGHRVQCRAFGVRYEFSTTVPVIFAGSEFTVRLGGKV